MVSLFALAKHGQHGSLSTGPGKYELNNSAGKRITVYYYKPKAYNPNTPVAVILHGRQRNAKTYRDNWIEPAENHNLMVLVPLFTNATYLGNNGYNFGNVLKATTDSEIYGLSNSGIMNPASQWSFALPDKVFAEFKLRENSQQSGYTLYGHGAGAQFAPRFALMMSNSQACHVISANSGLYAFPDRSMEWPYGLKGVSWVSDAQIDRFLQKPLLLMLGEKDTSSTYFTSKNAIAQGKNRNERGQHFFNYTQTLAKKRHVKFAWKLVHVPNADHNDALMAGPAAGYIKSCIQ